LNDRLISPVFHVPILQHGPENRAFRSQCSAFTIACGRALAQFDPAKRGVPCGSCSPAR
jgi:hypothetical protein